MKPPKITTVHQLLPSFSARDAIGNEALLMQAELRSMGFQSEIFAEQGVSPARPLPDVLPEASHKTTALLYHFSIASSIASVIAPLPSIKVVRYHSITPPWFFNDGSEMAARQACSLGRRQTPMVGAIADALIADSHHNAAEIAPYCRVKPVVIPVFRDYGRLVSTAATSTFATPLTESGKASLLFVGRVAPNKCQHDLLLLLHLAHRFISKDLRVILVGGFFSEEFKRSLLDLAAKLGLSVGHDPAADRDADVLIPHGVSDEDMASIYRHARVFVSMSEHEGFGVPLVEAMHFELPILAHAAAAVPETVGDAGLLCDKADWAGTVARLKAVLYDETLRDRLRVAMRARRQVLSLELSRARFKEWVASV